jgi:hypothetical protein
MENVLGFAPLVATLLRFRARACMVLACVAAMLFTASIASANATAETKTPVWDFSFAEPLNTWLERSASPRTHPAFSPSQSELASVSPHAARGVANEIPSTLARVIPGNVNPATLGRPGTSDVFVTAAEDIAGLTPAQIAERLAIEGNQTYTIFRFATPTEGLASPILRTNPGFVGGGRTAGGAREFVLPNGPIPSGASRIVVGQ